LPVDVKTYHDYRIWNKEDVEKLYEQMKIEWELEKVEIEKERIEQENKDKELAKSSDKTIKKYFKKTKSIIETAKHFKRDLKSVWDLFDDEILQETAEDYSDAREELGFEPEDWEIREYFDKNRSIQELASKYFDDELVEAWNFIEEYDDGADGLEGASDYDEVYEKLFPESDDEEDEKVIMEWFLSQEDRSIRELAKKYFDYNLEDAWNFIENYDHRSVDEYDAEDYDEVAEENGYVDEDDEDYQNEKAERFKKRLEKKKQNKMLLLHAIYDTPVDKGGLGLNYDGLDVKSRQELYKFLGGKKRRKTKKQKGGSKSKKSPKKDQIEKQIFNYAEHGNVQKLKQILKQILEDKEDNFNINWANPKENGNTPLCIAAENGRHEIVELLLTNGATVDKVNYDGQTPLMMSILNYYRDTTAEVLINNGADINKMDNNGKTPLHMACKKYGSPSMVKLLIKHGANVNEPEHNTFKNTPLHLAAMNHTDFGFLGSNAGNESNEEIATILLEAGADPELKNAKGQTVMELAESRRNHWVVEILKNFPKKKLHRATIGLLITQKRKTEPLSEAFKTLSNKDLNREIKSYLGGKKRSKRTKKVGRKTRKIMKNNFRKICNE
jgi:ankyrin repeat protein